MVEESETNSVRQNHTLVIQPWRSGELATLRRLAPMGASFIAEELGRTERSVRLMAARMRISLRRQGERRGRVLGHVLAIGAGDPTIARIRAAQLDDPRYDASRVERVVELSLAGEELCPSCAAGPIEVPKFGVCRNCYVRELAAAHRRELDHILAQRENDLARYHKHAARTRGARQEVSA
jgi:hypothetical protein